jgi:hypothetical protein
MAIASIEINANPVTAWEIYHKTLYPGRISFGANFYDYDRIKEADGGYGRLRFKMPGTKPELEQFFELGLGRDVQVFNDRGEYDYHGFIHTITLNTGVHHLRKSLAHVFNKVWGRYDDTGGVADTKRSTVYSNTNSQSRFGIIEKVIGGGQQSGLAAMDLATQNKLDWFAWPMIDPDLHAGSGDPYIEVVCAGYQHTMKWRMYNQTATTGNANINTVATAVMANCQFISSYEIATNVIQVPQEYDVDRNCYDILMSLAAMGDAAGNRWLARVEAGRKFTLGAAARMN